MCYAKKIIEMCPKRCKFPCQTILPKWLSMFLCGKIILHFLSDKNWVFCEPNMNNMVQITPFQFSKN
jgi:hypothetical protein